MLMVQTVRNEAGRRFTSSPPHMAKYAEEWIANGNTKFYTRIYSVPNPRAAVVFVHGFIEHIGRCVSQLLPVVGQHIEHVCTAMTMLFPSLRKLVFPLSVSTNAGKTRPAYSRNLTLIAILLVSIILSQSGMAVPLLIRAAVRLAPTERLPGRNSWQTLNSS
jgi:hypothetical protein